jgi:hypothetical protein
MQKDSDYTGIESVASGNVKLTNLVVELWLWRSAPEKLNGVPAKAFV